ncbi:MAG: hypothetical protein ACXAEU_14930 [Candidatus Hodarchaeales archaeon]|jgi:predicted regulator of Ras-like GTPase activity (Roadblock/LC7/MglB family)
MLLELDKTARRKLIKLLQEIITFTKLDLIAITTKQGVTIAFFSDKEEEVNSAIFSAIAASTAISGAAVTERMDHGEFDGVTVRGSEGYTILYNIEDFILIGSSSEFSSFGLADRILRKYIKFIPDIFMEDHEKKVETMISNLRSLL